jgi:hypothetical protein
MPGLKLQQESGMPSDRQLDWLHTLRTGSAWVPYSEQYVGRVMAYSTRGGVMDIEIWIKKDSDVVRS